MVSSVKNLDENCQDTKKVLLVDDEEFFSSALKKQFEREGYIVRTAKSGNEALSLLANDSADLIVSDYKMADGDGFYLLDRVMKNSPGLPFILMSGFPATNTQEVYAAGASAFIAKPFELAEMLGTIEDLMSPIEIRLPVVEVDEVDVDLYLQYQGSWASLARSKTFQLGSGGFSCESVERFRKNQLISFCIEFKLADHSYLKLTGRGTVKWIKRERGAPKGAFGVQFRNFGSSDVRDQVFDQIRQQKVKSFIP